MRSESRPRGDHAVPLFVVTVPIPYVVSSGGMSARPSRKTAKTERGGTNVDVLRGYSDRVFSTPLVLKSYLNRFRIVTVESIRVSS